MPRGPRPDAPGLTHHVTQRGVGQRDIFLDDDDRDNFLARLDRLVAEHGSRCFASALMSNHFHLALQTGTQPLALLMARLTTGYARYFNERHGHVGHVFQNRYGSRLILADDDLATVVVYVVRNPLEASIVSTVEALARYPWTSYGALVGERQARPFETIGGTLRLFGDTNAAARTELRRRVAQTGHSPVEEPADTWGASGAMGAERAAAFGALATRICARRGVLAQLPRSGTRSLAAVAARAEIARLAVAQSFTRAEIAVGLRVTESAVCRLLRWEDRSGRGLTQERPRI